MANAPFIFGFAGWSGSGKTTLAEKIITRAAKSGIAIATIKHAHHHFEADIEGKDSWRHRKAGAGQVLVASDHRMALFTEKTTAKPPILTDLIARLEPADWILVEGFKQAAFTKIEIYDADLGKEPLHHADSSIVAVCGKTPPNSCLVPYFDRDDDGSIFAFLQRLAREKDAG